MQELRINFCADDGVGSDADIDGLRADIEQHVGPASFLAAEGGAGAKGIGIDLTTLAVSLLGTPAVVALVGVLKSYFESDRVTELELSGPGGSAKLKLPRGSQLSSAQIEEVLTKVMGTRAP
jgi:hypothetical protein